jgi:NAD(P)-dependent dehydrogenase (short-subunit alcohol dehydrogenase family)
MTQTWLITGVSGGLGREIALAAIARGDTVFGTVRKAKDADAFELLGGQALVLDVTDEAAVRAGVAQAEAAAGRIDILVNNAGYGLVGAVEEASLDEVRAQFETNVMGPLAMLKAVLPAMRARRGGRIINITSVSGLAVWAGTGVYCASKWALEGLTQTLAAEVAELGIKVTNVAPAACAPASGPAPRRSSPTRSPTMTAWPATPSGSWPTTPATSRAIRPRRPRPSWPSPTRPPRPCTCCWARTPSNTPATPRPAWPGRHRRLEGPHPVDRLRRRPLRLRIAHP